MIEFLAKFSNEFLSLLAVAFGVVLVYMIKKWLLHIVRKIDMALNKLDLISIEQESTDYALEKNFSNGYSKYKKEKREQLIEEYEFKMKERK